MMRRNIVRTGLITVCAAMMLLCPVSVSAAEPAEAAAVPAEAGADPAQALPQTAPVDHETALLQSAQAEVVLRGLALDKYHNINVLGDSITEGVGARTPDKAYPVILSKLTGANVNNYGLSCSRITDIPVGLSNPPSFIDRMYAMDKTADLVIVFGGTND